MDKESNSFPKSNANINSLIQVDLNEFQISEETFKPMTKGLGFHQDTKRSSFTPAPKENKTFVSSRTKLSATLNNLPVSTLSSANTKAVIQNQLPSGLEAFYGKSLAASEESNLFDQKIISNEKTAHLTSQKLASSHSQFFAWLIDILVIASFVVFTGAMLILSSGIDYKLYSRLISKQDLSLFTAAIFAIYYMLYFTILDLSATPGKTIFGIHLVKTNGESASVKHTFSRAMISLLSGIALFLPMLLDFQGRLSDTKVVK
jgi:uncharacterized RDD family membrane protein YckC